MSDTSIHAFRSRAVLDPNSEIRVTGNDETKLNKGTFGQRVASWWRDVKESFGKLDPSREERQRTAIKNFKEALAAFYGDDVAKRAIGALGLGNRVTRLTGEVVLRIEREAQRFMHTNSSTNRSNINNLLPPVQGGEASKDFRALIEDVLGEGVAPTPEELREYEARFLNRVESEDLGVAHGKEWFRTIAKETLQHVHGLSGAGKLDRATRQRQEVTEHFKDTLKALARGSGSPSPVHGLSYGLVLLQQQANIEAGKISPLEVMALAREALSQAMKELHDENPRLLGRLQEKLQSKDSPLRAIHAHIAGTNPNELSPWQREMLTGMHMLAEAIVEGVSTRCGGLSGSVGGDVDVLKEGDGVSGGAMRKARRAVNDLLDFMHANPVAHKQYVSQVRDQYAEVVDGQVTWKLDVNGFPLWNSEALLQSLETSVKSHAVGDRVTIDVAIQNFRAAIDGDRTMPPGLKQKLGRALDAIMEEYRLLASVDNEELDNLKPDDFWRLFLPQEVGQEQTSKWSIEHRQPGSLAAMLRAFRETMQPVQGEPQPLTSERLLAIHQRATENTFDGNLLQFTYRNDITDDAKAAYLDQARIPTGYRVGQALLTMHVDSGEVTDGGRQEITDGIDDWCQVQENAPPGQFVLIYPEKEPDQCRQRAQQILDNHYAELPNRNTTAEKRLLIAETIQALYRSNLFKDGNTGTVVLTAMNRLLIEAGLSPAILPQPKGAGGFSRQEFSQEILKGQIAFQCLSRDRSESLTDFLRGQVDLHCDGEKVPVEQAIDFYRRMIGNNQAIPQAYRNELMAGLDGVQETIGDELYRGFIREPAYSKVKRDDVWRLVAGERPENTTGMQRQFDAMLSTRSENPFLTAELIELINQHGLNPGYVDNLDRDYCRGRVTEILKDLRENIRSASENKTLTDERRMRLIAIAIHDLYHPPLFKDHSTGMVLMQRLLLEGGLPPVMLDPGAIPENYDAFVRQVEAGQLAFAWRTKNDSVETLTFLEGRLDSYQKLDMSFEEALDRLHREVQDNPMLTPEEQNSLLSGIMALRSARDMVLSSELNSVEDKLHHQLSTIESFGHIKRDEMWRLFATGEQLNPNGSNPIRSKEEFLRRNGPESLLSLERAFSLMLEGYDKKQPLTAQHVLDINQAGPKPGFRDTSRVITTTPESGWDDFDTLKQLPNDDIWFRGMQIQEGQSEVRVNLPPPPSQDQCAQRIELILNTYRHSIELIDDRRDTHREEIRNQLIERALSRIPESERGDVDVEGLVSEQQVDHLLQLEMEAQKKTAIGKAVQDLYRAQIFAEDERQWTVLIVMNRMLLDVGLPPAIILNPQQLFTRKQRIVNPEINMQGANIYRNWVPKDEIIILNDYQDDLSKIIEIVPTEVVDLDESSEDVPVILIEDPRFPGGTGALFTASVTRYVDWLSIQDPPGDNVGPNEIIRVRNPNDPQNEQARIPVLRAAYLQWIEAYGNQE